MTDILDKKYPIKPKHINIKGDLFNVGNLFGVSRSDIFAVLLEIAQKNGDWRDFKEKKCYEKFGNYQMFESTIKTGLDELIDSEKIVVVIEGSSDKLKDERTLGFTHVFISQLFRYSPNFIEK